MSGLEHITLLKINSSALNCNYLGLIFAIRLSAKFRKSWICVTSPRNKLKSRKL